MVPAPKSYCGRIKENTGCKAPDSDSWHEKGSIPASYYDSMKEATIQGLSASPISTLQSQGEDTASGWVCNTAQVSSPCIAGNKLTNRSRGLAVAGISEIRQWGVSWSWASMRNVHGLQNLYAASECFQCRARKVCVCTLFHYQSKLLSTIVNFVSLSLTHESL